MGLLAFTDIQGFVALHPVVKGALNGLLVAAGVDYHVFLGYHGWSDYKNFNFSMASFRWFMGAVTGAVASSALAAIFG